MNDINGREQLIVFVKNRKPGTVKTRLASSIGNKAALDVYSKLVEITSAAASEVDVKRLVSYSGNVEKGDAFDDKLFDKNIQSGDDLGTRMLNAFDKAFADGNRKVVLIGSDCPEISAKIIQNAFQKLDDADCVFGPASDGGYYLIGLRKRIPQLFKEMEWSVETVLDESRKRLESLSVHYNLLPVLNDIDNLEDLKKSRINL